MKVFTCTKFEGHRFWPAGTSAVIVARDRRHARRLMNIKAHEQGLPIHQGVPLDLDDFEEVDPTKEQAIILPITCPAAPAHRDGGQTDQKKKTEGEDQ